jgi:nucleotide-binding universal stress UspA family protein
MFPKRILVGFDGSPESRRALDLAVDLAKAGGANVFVQHVITVAPEAFESGALNYAEIQASADRTLEEAVERARAAGVTATKILSTGDAARMLLAEAEGRGADLLIVGSLGRGRMARLLVGSVADKLVRMANVPVLVVR